MKNSVSFSTRYRPTNSSTILGEGQINTVESFLGTSKDQIPHEILLSGPSGSGKTTIAQIIMRYIMGLSEDEDIDNYVTTINCTTENGIQMVRGLLGEINRGSLFSDYRIYFLDEVHGLTTAAQNGFLIDTEALPNHVYFVACTTDPSKLIDTFVSRFDQHVLKSPTQSDMIKRIKYLMQLEDKKIDKEVAYKITQAANGNMRTLDKLVQQAFSGKLNIQLSDVENPESLIHHLFFKKPNIQKWFQLARKEKNIGSTINGFCGYASVLIASPKTKAAHLNTAMNVLHVFSQGTYDPVVSESNKFYGLLVQLYSELT